jgi:hypothetical protein
LLRGDASSGYREVYVDQKIWNKKIFKKNELGGEPMKLLDKKKEHIEKAFVRKTFSWLSAMMLEKVETIEVAQEETASGKFNLLIIHQKDGKVYRYNMPCAVYTEKELKIVFDALLAALK